MFSYDSSDLATELNRIRFELGDTDENDYFLADEEIIYVQSIHDSFNSRMLHCIRVVKTILGRIPKNKISSYSEDYTNVIKFFDNLEKKYQKQGTGSYPWSSSLTQDDKDTYQDDTDLVQPKFKKGIHDNT